MINAAAAAMQISVPNECFIRRELVDQCEVALLLLNTVCVYIPIQRGVIIFFTLLGYNTFIFSATIQSWWNRPVAIIRLELRPVP